MLLPPSTDGAADNFLPRHDRREEIWAGDATALFGACVSTVVLYFAIIVDTLPQPESSPLAYQVQSWHLAIVHSLFISSLVAANSISFVVSTEVVAARNNVAATLEVATLVEGYWVDQLEI